MSNILAIKDEGGEYKHFEVCPEVYMYVIQLETYILNPGASRLKIVYPDRFPE